MCTSTSVWPSFSRDRADLDQAGPEIGVASTKAYTSQYVALVMIAVQLCDDSIAKTARRQQIIDGLHDIPSQIKHVLTMDKALQQLAKDMLSNQKSLLIMGRGYQCTCDVRKSHTRADVV